MLLNPHEYDPAHFDAETRRLLRATIDWFEQRGKAKLTEDYHARTFYADFLEFAGKEGLFSTFLTPSANAGGNPDKRWDTARVAALSEILGFYGLNYWYPWQVTILGLGPVWQSGNDVARKRAADALDAGGVGAFGLSEKDHGADIYSSDLVLTKDGDGYRATGSKYYIGNGNCARTVSVFGRIDGVEGPDQYVFFYADSEHPNYHVVKNVVPSQMYVAEFRLEDYPVHADDILHVGAEAFSAALNTVNIGKFNLCFGGIGMATHSLYEAITHAHNRVLYGKPVTNFPHVRREFVEAYARLTAMKLFSDRAVDYFRSAHAEDRRYLLFNPITKMKVTTEAQKVIGLVADVVAAKGFEADTYLAMSKNDIDGLPKLEGTVAVNLALIAKFMPAYLFAPQEYAPVADPHRRRGRRVPLPPGPGARPVEDPVPRLEDRLRRGRAHPERRAVHRAGRLPGQAAHGGGAGRGPAGRPRLRARADRAVHAHRVRPAGPGAGADHRPRRRGRRPDLRGAGAGLQRRGDGPQRQGEFDRSPAGDRAGRLRKPVVDAERFENVWARVRALSGAYAMNP